MEVFKEIRSHYEVELKSEIEFEYEYEKLVTIHRRFQAKNILLDNLEVEFMKLGKERFIEAASLALGKDNNLCSPNYIFDTDEISEFEKEYYKELMAFNRQFLSKNLYKLGDVKIVKFLTEGLLINNISKEFLVSLRSVEPKPGFWNFFSAIKKAE